MFSALSTCMLSFRRGDSMEYPYDREKGPTDTLVQSDIRNAKMSIVPFKKKWTKLKWSSKGRDR